MKTYKEMAADVLRRRDEYEENKGQGLQTFKKVTAIAVTVVFVLSAMIVGPIVGRIMKEQQNQPADGTKINTDTETTADQDTETTETADVTTEVGETTGEETSGDETTGNNYPIEPTVNYSPIEYIPKNGADVEIDVRRSPEKNPFMTLYGYKQNGDILNYKLRYNSVYYLTWKDSLESVRHGDHVKIIIVYDESKIEMISPSYLILETPEAYADFDISFRYVNGATNGNVNVFYIEDMSEYYYEIDENTNINNYYVELNNKTNNSAAEYISSRFACFAAIKGYDFFAVNHSYENMYYDVAVHFGDVDENGVPLYKNDPYMEDYYDCPECVQKRSIIPMQ